MSRVDRILFLRTYQLSEENGGFIIFRTCLHELFISCWKHKLRQGVVWKIYLFTSVIKAFLGAIVLFPCVGLVLIAVFLPITLEI